MIPIRRDVRCSLPAERIRDWHSRGPPVTHFFNALSIFFPVGERFFIASIRNYRDQVTDAQLKEAVTAFIGQEAMHGREHERYNRLLKDDGMPVSALERSVAWALGAAQKLMPKSWQLATTLALEHHTAILADRLLSRPDLLQDSEPAFARLWRWHALEETEHKGVAFDVWNEVVGGDRVHHPGPPESQRSANYPIPIARFASAAFTMPARPTSDIPISRKPPSSGERSLNSRCRLSTSARASTLSALRARS